jgi:hypothetical protein
MRASALGDGLKWPFLAQASPGSTEESGRGRRAGMIRKAGMTRKAALLALLLTCGCGGSGKSAKSSSDVNCPTGQTFDGEFCQVDQTVATREQPAPAPEEQEPVAPSPEPEPEPTEDPIQPVPPEGEPSPAIPPKMATPVDVTMAAQAGPLISYMAGAHLPAGARSFGSPFAGQFAEGQILERKVQLSLGRCYTVVAAGLPHISEVNVELFPEGATVAAAKDSTVGMQAVLGSRQDCFKPVASGTYRLVLTVEKGQGVAAAQVFEK